MYQNKNIRRGLKGWCHQTIFTGAYKDLYDDIIKPPSLGGLYEAIDNYGNIIIGEFKLRESFPLKLQLMSILRRDSCGCDICILETSLQAYLNICRLINILLLEQLDEPRGRTRSPSLFHEGFTTYRVCAHTNGCHPHKCEYDDALYT